LAFAAMLERHHGLQGFSIWGNPGVAGVGLSPDACQVRVLPTLGIVLTLIFAAN
jgi:hypothetical protein